MAVFWGSNPGAGLGVPEIVVGWGTRGLALSGWGLEARAKG